MLAKDRQRQFFHESICDFLHENLMTDVRLIAEEKEFPAHKLILAASSPYFKTMFTGCLVESSSNKVYLKDVKKKSLEILINFIYTGQLDDLQLEVEELVALLTTADYLQMDIVIRFCWDKLLQQCKGRVKSYPLLLSIAEQYENTIAEIELMNCALTLYQQSDGTIVNCLSKNQLLRFLQNYFPGEESPFLLMQIILDWCNMDSDRLKDIASVLTELCSSYIAEFLSFFLRKKPMLFKCLNFMELATKHTPYSLDNMKLENVKGELLALIQKKQKPNHLCISDVDYYVWDNYPCTKGHFPVNSSYAIVGSVLYVIGGETIDGKYKVATKATQTLNLPISEESVWNPGFDLIVARADAGSAVLNGSIYVVGGRQKDRLLRSVEFLDSRHGSMKWKKKVSLHEAMPSPQVAAFNDKLYAVCSYMHMECYDPVTHQWSIIADHVTLTSTPSNYPKLMRAGRYHLYILVLAFPPQLYQFEPSSHKCSLKNLPVKDTRENGDFCSVTDFVMRNGPDGNDQIWVAYSDGRVFMLDEKKMAWIKCKSNSKCVDSESKTKLIYTSV